MNKNRFRTLLFVVTLAATTTLSAFGGDLTPLVNPFVGTTTLWEPQDLGYTRTWDGTRTWGGETSPGATLPNAMVQVSPVTMYRSGSGYQYEDNTIRGFAHTTKGHWNLLHLPIMPVTGAFYTPSTFNSWYSHDDEEAHPGYYRVFLQRYQIQAEMTSTLRCAYHRYTYRPDDTKQLVVDIRHNNSGDRQRGEVTQSGDHSFQGWQDGEGRIYFYAVTNYPIKELGLQRDFKNQYVLVDFSESTNAEPLEVKIGFSFVSIDNARENLKAEMEGKTFAQVRQEADDTWESLLGHVQVEGGEEATQRMFYTTLYRSFLWPCLRSDVNGEYRDARGQIVKGDFNYYNHPSFWDTYRNKLILLGMISPDVAADVIKSCIDDGEKRGGYMPTFFHGDHAVTFVVGSWLRGIHDFDLQRAYDLVLKNATVPGRGGRPYLDEYLAQGWIAEKDTTNVPHWDEYKAAVTKTVEYAYDDYAVAQIARLLGDKKNYKMLMEHAQNYRNVFDPSTGFFRGRIADGSWIKDFDPYYAYFAYMYREANAWNNLFFAPHDPEGLIGLYPSHQAVEAKLDSLFTEPWHEQELHNMTGFLGNYCHGNQPGHSIPYTYYFVDRQWKAQRVLNILMDRYYGMGREHLAYAGMDDAGEMSAWYALNAIGLYTYSPADPEYIVTVPRFTHVHFTLGTNGQTFTIERHGEGERIQRITCNGKPLKGWFVPHDKLAAGATLTIDVEPAPADAPFLQ